MELLHLVTTKLNSQGEEGKKLLDLLRKAAPDDIIDPSDSAGFAVAGAYKLLGPPKNIATITEKEFETHLKESDRLWALNQPNNQAVSDRLSSFLAALPEGEITLHKLHGTLVMAEVRKMPAKYLAAILEQPEVTHILPNIEIDGMPFTDLGKLAVGLGRQSAGKGQAPAM